MAHNKKVTTYDVQPIEVDGKLTGLEIQQWHRVQRVSATGKVLDHGINTQGDAIEIPIYKVADLIRELADWPIWFATWKDN